MATDVVRDPDRTRYSILVDGAEAGFVATRLGDGTITLTHTEIDPERQGEGLAGRLIQGALDDIRASTELRVVPTCPYAAAWIARHPDYQDLTER